MAEQKTILSCEHLVKSFTGVRALKGVNFDLRAGEIHGLLGENGAGKSTLIKIISGIHTVDVINRVRQGKVLLDGQEVFFRSPLEAMNAGIMTIHQEINVIPDMMVYENIFLNYEITKNALVDRKEMIRRVEEMTRRFGVELDPKAQVKSLSTDNQKLIEVLRALSQEAKVLIMDEPTSMLNDVETEHLFTVLRNIAKQGIGVIFISHNLQEAVNLCDRITIIRNGELVKVFDREEVDVDTIILNMIGKDIYRDKIRDVTSRTDQELMRVEKLTIGKLKDINLTLNAGEIVGVTGLVGSGVAELAKALYGANRDYQASGRIFIKGKEVSLKNESTAIKHGISLLTDDRKNEGLFLRFSIFQNITIPLSRRYRKYMLLTDTKKRRSDASRFFSMLNIKANSADTIVETLSGGNQQKIVISRWLNINPDIFIMHEPNIGIDVGTKVDVRRIIWDLAKQGKGVLLVTTEYADLTSLCDRVLCLVKGKIVAEMTNEEMTEVSVKRYVMGGTN